MKLLTAFYTIALATSNATAQQIALAGYRLGAVWSQVAKSMPCQTNAVADSMMRPMFSQRLVKGKDCSPTGAPNLSSLTLSFGNDTLYMIAYYPCRSDADSLPCNTHFSEETQWDQFWKRWSIARFGEPDSVAVIHGAFSNIREIRAFWNKSNGRFVAHVGISSMGVNVQLCAEVVAGLNCGRMLLESK